MKVPSNAVIVYISNNNVSNANKAKAAINQPTFFLENIQQAKYGNTLIIPNTTTTTSTNASPFSSAYISAPAAPRLRVIYEENRKYD